jgi:wyosine [tRNA(Phe)-imidazoG37] synthetase (radical SAM superfamily)
MNYVYGPIPSRRLGKSLGISTIVKKTCNLSCVYCMLGLTDKMTDAFVLPFSVEEIIEELKELLNKVEDFDCVSIVGEGEPTLYRDLGKLIKEIKLITDKPIALITNGTNFTKESVYDAALEADIVLPSLDAYDELSFKKINRPHKNLDYEKIIEALIKFSHEYQGSLWVEIMILKDYNDSSESVEGFKKNLKKMKYDKIYLNSPVRPPAIKTVKPTSHERLEAIAKELSAINIDILAEPKFHSAEADDYLAILSIIRRHPMNQFEINAFLDSRKTEDKEAVFNKLKKNSDLEVINYKTYDTYRFKLGR